MNKNSAKMIRIADSDFFRDWLHKISGGASLSSISNDIGHGDTYLSQAANRKRIALSAAISLENKFGISHEDMLTALKSNKSLKQNDEQNAETATIEEIKKLMERQTAMLSSIGQILTVLEDVIVKAWS